MNPHTIKGQWNQVSGKIKQQWGKLTDDDMKIVQGNVQMLAGRLQERYGIARDEAEREIRAFEESLQMSRRSPSHLKH
ncbi:MAG TPA: CsbD family protein [Dyella sp.]|uniref:CsbD family protein n=1 Tax=Dyella sp. TaxID=1869338 RepID=UPI002D0FEFE6|nr:CsbD family protein [Dyella sp.]HTV85365.1 CsbD family protein [Dyella sp.]